METLVVNPIHGTVGWRKNECGELEGLLWSTKITPAGWITIVEYVRQRRDRAEAFRRLCMVNPHALGDKIMEKRKGRRWGGYPRSYYGTGGHTW